MREKDVVGIVTFDLIGSLPTNHIIAYIIMAYSGLTELCADAGPHNLAFWGQSRIILENIEKNIN